MAYYDLAGSRVRYEISTSNSSHVGKYTQYRARADITTTEYDTEIGVTIVPSFVYGKQKWGPQLDKVGLFDFYCYPTGGGWYDYYCNFKTLSFSESQDYQTIYPLGTLTTVFDKRTSPYNVTFNLNWEPQSGPVYVASGDQYFIRNTNDYSTSNGTAGSATSSGALTITIPALASYSITYNANGGSGAPANQIKYYGSNIYLQSGVPTRAGYKFMGWSTSSTATSASYSAGQLYQSNAGLDLYAVWHRNPSINTPSSPSQSIYYSGAQTYSVNYSGATKYDSATISSIKLYIGSQSSPSLTTTSGTLSITPNTVGTFTPQIVIVDSLGASTTYNLNSITVKANTAPTISAYASSSPPYFSNYSTYEAVITATATNDKTLTSITMTVGSSTTTNTKCAGSTSYKGTFSVKVPTVSSKTSKDVVITATDNLGVPKSLTLQTIDVYPDNAPTATYSTNSGPYFGGASNYEVTINATPGEAKTIVATQVTLTNTNDDTQILQATGLNNTTLSIPLPTVSTNTEFTVSLQAQDSTNKVWTQQLTNNIIVYPNTAPTATYTTSTGNYYLGVNAKPYKVTINSVSTSHSGKTISEIRLILGSETVTRTNVGDLIIYPTQVLSNEVPILTITDSKGAFRTYQLPAISVYSNTAPTAVLSVTSSAPYYETPNSVSAHTYYTVSLTNLTFANQKTLKSITLSLGSESTTITSVSGTSATLSISPTIAGINVTPVVTIVDTFPSGDSGHGIICNTTVYNFNNTNVLQNITIQSRTLAISGLRVQRVNNSKISVDDGVQALLTVTINYSQFSGNKLQQPNVTVTDGTSSNLPATVTWYSSWNPTTGAGTAINWSNYAPTSPVTIYGHITSFTKNNVSTFFEKDKSYIISFTPASTVGAATILTSTAILPQAFYLLVGRAGGHALGIGKKPTADGQLDIGMQRTILNHNTSWQDPSPYISYRVGNTVVDMIKFSAENNIPANATIEFYNNQDVANRLIDSLSTATAHWTDNTLILTSDVSGDTSLYYRRAATSAWNYIKTKLSNGSNDTSYYILKDSTIDLTQANNGVTATTERYFGVRDKNSSLFGLFEVMAKSNGDTTVSMGLRNQTSGDNPTLTDWTGFSINKTKANSTSFSLGCGGTISGTLKVNNLLTLYREGTTADNYPAGIKFSVKDTTTGATNNSGFIYAYQDHGTSVDSDNNPVSYGVNMVIQPGGNLFIGSGESPDAHYKASYVSSTTENTYITADGNVFVQANGNTIANRLGFYLNTSHQLLPCKADAATNNVGSIGNSSYRWASIYAGTINTSSSITATGAISSSSSITATGNITAGNASQTTERDVIASSAAGRIYLYSTGSNTGNRGIYMSNAAGTGASVLWVGQDNIVQMPWFKVVANGVTTQIGSQGSSFCHIYTDGSNGFAFDKGFAMVGNGTIGTTGYPTGNIIMKYLAKLISLGSGGESISLIRLSGPDSMTLGAAAVHATQVYGDFYPASNGSKLGVSGYRWGTIYATNGTINTSDKKDKDILGNITNAKDLILNLKPINYMWKDGDHRRIRMGFIAQDVATICKRLNKNLALIDAHYKDCENKPYYGEEVDDVLLHWGLNYKELVAPIVAVIQEQEQEIQQLKQQLSSIQQHLNLTE